MDTHRDFAVGRMNNSSGRETYRKLWAELTVKLNSAGFGERPVEKWQKSWTDYKCALKKKASEIRRGQQATGGGPELEKILTELELKILWILGTTFYDGVGVTEHGGCSSNNSCSQAQTAENESPATTSCDVPQKRKLSMTYERPNGVEEVVSNDHDYLFMSKMTPPPTKKVKTTGITPQIDDKAFKIKDAHWELIVDFMENHPDFATGKINNPAGRETYKRLWKELTLKLNSTGLGERTVEKWQKTWTDFKCNLKKKASDIRRAQNGTGGGPECEKKLTDLEKKILDILGNIFYQGCGTTEHGLKVTRTPITQGQDEIPSTNTTQSTVTSMYKLSQNSITVNPNSPTTSKRKIENLNTITDDHDYDRSSYKTIPTSVETPSKKIKVKATPDEMYAKTLSVLEKINVTLGDVVNSNVGIANAIQNLHLSIDNNRIDIGNSLSKLVDVMSETLEQNAAIGNAVERICTSAEIISNAATNIC